MNIKAAEQSINSGCYGFCKELDCTSRVINPGKEKVIL
jgi:hypothetical protein